MLLLSSLRCLNKISTSDMFFGFVISFLHAVACLALAPVSNSQAHQNSSLLIDCYLHASFLLVDAILITVEHSKRF